MACEHPSTPYGISDSRCIIRDMTPFVHKGKYVALSALVRIVFLGGVSRTNSVFFSRPLDCLGTSSNHAAIF